MLRKLWQALVATPRPEVVEIQHARLGVLRFSPEDECWVAGVEAEGRTIRFLVDGEGAPDPQALAHAECILESFGTFRQRLGEFMQEQAARSPKLAAQEILQLELESIVLFSQRGSGGGMVYFTGPDEFRVWRCDYRGGEFRDLGFDD